MVYFQTIHDSCPIKYGANGWMFNLVNVLRVFNARVNYSMLVVKEWRQLAACDVAILVYGGCKNRSPVLLKPFGIVSPAAKK